MEAGSNSIFYFGNIYLAIFSSHKMRANRRESTTNLIFLTIEYFTVEEIRKLEHGQNTTTKEFVYFLVTRNLTKYTYLSKIRCIKL